MKIIYLASFKAEHPGYDIVYQDINGKRDLDGDMLDIDLTPYDVIIATPPCNFYSRANYRYLTSEYSQKTKNLLPSIIFKLQEQSKPYIVENVINRKRMKGIIKNFKDFYYEIGRHSYFTNIPINLSNIKQEYDFRYGGVPLVKNTQGGDNVHNVFEYWLKVAQAYV